MLGTVEEPEFLLFRRIRLRADVIVSLVVLALRLIGATLRYRLDDRAGFTRGAHAGGCILAFWHNRLFAMPRALQLFYGSRKGAFALTSASGEGTVLSKILARFGIGAVRGSSSRDGAAAALELTQKIRGGFDIVITPDGPRGPRYELGPGIVFLARKSHAPVLPIHVRYSHGIELRTWDRFLIPLPFSRVEIEIGPFLFVDAEEADEIRARQDELEMILRTGAEDRRR
jgi:lysophospholipid acyltransferase (LPLAT)-like uncharacterized protein